MKNKCLIFILIILLVSTAFALEGPQGPLPENDTQPLKERLEFFYEAKEGYINQKIQCKEEVMITQAPQGTCWERLKPVLINLVLDQINLTERRLAQLHDKNITFPDIDSIKTQLDQGKSIFTNQGSSKNLLKSTAKNLENLVNDIEETATRNQTGTLITQMDNLMIKADDITAKLEIKLEELRNAGVDVTSLESSLEDYKAEIETTKVSVNEAKVKYAQMGSTGEIADLATQVRTLINNAQNNLVKAFDKAKAMSLSMSQSESQVSVS